jgi:glycosyltransferase involved in cell wall biosynthesis
MQRLRVLFLSSSYPLGPDDSSSSFLREFAEWLTKKGIEVHVLAPAREAGGTARESGVVVHRFRYAPIPWQRLAYGSGIVPNIRREPYLVALIPFFTIAMAFALVRTTRSIRPTLIHAHWVIPQGLIALLAKFALGTPVIISAHGADAFALRSRMLSAIKRFALHHCDAWTANTRATAAALLTNRNTPTPRIIPMGVDIDLFASGSPARLPGTLHTVDLVALFVGRLVEKKGVDVLIKAFALFQAQPNPPTQLWIIGRGHMESELKHLCEQLGVAEKVRFLGEIPNRLLPDYYAAADLFVGPSIRATSGDTEGQGVVFLEAAAANLCVLATRVGGIDEVVEHNKTGILVSPQSPAELAAALRDLLNNPGKRDQLAREASANVRKRYSWQEISDAFLRVYADAIRGDCHYG